MRARDLGEVRLPAEEASFMTEGHPASALLVEDLGLFRMVMKAALSARFPGLRVLEAGTVAEGRRVLREHRPGIVFLDINLPDGNGLEVAAWVRRFLPATRVVICTSYDLPEYRQAAERYGAARFLSKSELDWEEICDLVAAEIGPGDSSPNVEGARE